jgi:hypothetical protein
MQYGGFYPPTEDYWISQRNQLNQGFERPMVRPAPSLIY